MVDIKLKRIYEDPDKQDGYRVLVDKMWPRGKKKEDVHYDAWDKELAPSTELREWFHEDADNRWPDFRKKYEKELSESAAMKDFIDQIKEKDTVTLLYASKDTEHNQAEVLKEYLDKKLKKNTM